MIFELFIKKFIPLDFNVFILKIVPRSERERLEKNIFEGVSID